MALNTLNQLESIHQRRVLLQALSQLICNLSGANNGLSTVQHIIRPSQKFSASVRSAVAAEIAFYLKQDAEVSKQKLKQLDHLLEKNYSVLLSIVHLDDDKFLKHFRADEASTGTFQKLQASMALFQKQAKHNLAIRIVLQDNGVQIERSKLTLNQELIATELATISNREKQRRTQLKTEVRNMLNDIELLMTVTQNNPAIHLQLTENHNTLENILEVLAAGGSPEGLPHLIENIHHFLPNEFNQEHTDEIIISDLPHVPPPGKLPSKLITPLRAHTQGAPRPLGFWRRITIWLSKLGR